MKSARRGKRTSAIEVTNVSRHGFWLFIGEKELFLSFEHFPWFREVSISQLLNVELPQPHHLYWPDLDVDIAVESIVYPERYPLVSKVRPDIAPQRTASRVAARAGHRPRHAARR